MVYLPLDREKDSRSDSQTATGGTTERPPPHAVAALINRVFNEILALPAFRAKRGTAGK
jgi:hypothetical protein